MRVLMAHDQKLREIWDRRQDPEAARKVETIIAEVRKNGDRALLELTRTFDGVDLEDSGLAVSPEEIPRALEEVGADFRALLEEAAARIKSYHQAQLAGSWWQAQGGGRLLGQLVRPIKRVGIYVPGGTAPLASSVLMNAIPAKVAGVKEVVMVTPPGKDGRVSPTVLAAAAIAGVSEVYRVGGAQAIAALAYGTGTIRPVDKITGPGNLYVTLAKQLVFGQVGLDMLAGPSEVLVVADDSASPGWLAADLLSQAEHDPLAAAVLLTPSRKIIDGVQAELTRQLKTLPRREIAGRSLEDHGALVLTASLNEALELANSLAPEHLELAVAEPFSWLDKVENAGTVFLGHFTPEPLGDYLAGSNHILPTLGSARFSSPLGTLDFLKRTAVVYYGAEASAEDAGRVAAFARAEGLEAHARSAEARKEERP